MQKKDSSFGQVFFKFLNCCKAQNANKTPKLITIEYKNLNVISCVNLDKTIFVENLFNKKPDIMKQSIIEHKIKLMKFLR